MKSVDTQNTQENSLNGLFSGLNNKHAVAIGAALITGTSGYIYGMAEATGVTTQMSNLQAAYFLMGLGLGVAIYGGVYLMPKEGEDS